MAETYSISCSLSQPKHVHNICFADIACCVSGGVVYVCVCVRGRVIDDLTLRNTLYVPKGDAHTHTHTASYPKGPLACHKGSLSELSQNGHIYSLIFRSFQTKLNL